MSERLIGCEGDNEVERVRDSVEERGRVRD